MSTASFLVDFLNTGSPLRRMTFIGGLQFIKDRAAQMGGVFSFDATVFPAISKFTFEDGSAFTVSLHGYIVEVK